MPVNLQVPENVSPVSGVTLTGVSAGLKKSGAKDLVLISLPPDTNAAAVFTRNAYCAAPVTLGREHLATTAGQIRALLINSGAANAATGRQGVADARVHCDHVAKVLGIKSEEVLPFSTGVIGVPLPENKMVKGIDLAVGELGDTANHWRAAAEGIMTTDTVYKQYSVTVNVGADTITLTGFAKGSGMIQPNMATMLAYVFTDAAIESTLLQNLLAGITEKTFNSITVDGDTSTNDSLVLAATGASGVSLNESHPDWQNFAMGLEQLCTWLAHSLVRDGEGASKFITINVSGGREPEDCRQVALTVGNSPLVKTAFFASDANLGRIIMAVGRSGVDYLDIDQLSVSLGNAEQRTPVLIKGQPASDYTDEIGQSIMQASELWVGIDLGAGNAEWTCWASDLSHDYVSINADYRS